MSDFYSRSIGTPPHTFRLTDEGVDLDGFEPGWYWVLVNECEQHVVLVVVGPGDVHGIWEPDPDGGHNFRAIADLNPLVCSAWAGPLPDPGWDSQFPELNCGTTDRFPPTARAASTGCVGTGDVDARCIPFVAWLRQVGFPHYELSAKGCTADEALRAEVSRG